MASSHFAAPPVSRSRLRIDRSASIAVAYRESNRSAIASRMRAAARGTPPAETPITIAPALWDAIPLKSRSLGRSETLKRR